MHSSSDDRRALPLQPRDIVAGRYEVLKCLGVGSLGTVYLCRSLENREQLVALKELIPALSSTKEGALALARFRNEVAVLLRIRHPHVVQIFEYLSEPPLTAYIMEYVAGGDLGSYLRAHPPLPIGQVARLLQHVCRGVDAIRLSGIVHRDLKPSNILLSEDGIAKIADFGIARADDGPRLTARGGIVGTIEYMSPEYLEHGVVSPQGDVYSVGVIGYEMVAGRTPYAGLGMLKTVDQKLTSDPPPPSARNPRCPAWLDKIILRALSRVPSQRYTTTAEMAAALADGITLLHEDEHAEAARWRVVPAAKTHSFRPEQARVVQLSPRPEMSPARRINFARLGAGGIALGLLGCIALALTFRQPNLTPPSGGLARMASVQAPSVNETHTGLRDEAFTDVAVATSDSEVPPGVLQPLIVEPAALSPEAKAPVARVTVPKRIPGERSINSESSRTDIASLRSVPVLSPGEGTSTSRTPSRVEAPRVEPPRSPPSNVQVELATEAPEFARWIRPVRAVPDLKTEFKVRATLLYRLADYITWPERAFPDSSSPMRLCVMGRDPFGLYLDQVVAPVQHRNGRSYHPVRLAPDTPVRALSSCQILYLSQLPASAVDTIREGLKSQPVLLISENPGSGMIDFVLRDQKVKFIMEQSRMEQASLAPAPMLLDLALSSGGER